LVVLVSTLLALTVAEVAVRLMGHAPWRAIRSFDAAPTMTEPDADLGWRNKPGAHRYNPSGQAGGEIAVTINGDGGRGNYADNGGTSPVWMMGCSFTYGWAVTDGAEYPAVAAARLNGQHAIQNWGAPGYSTVQSYLLFERLRQSRPPPYAVVYGLVEFHDERNAGTRNWLGLLTRAAARQNWLQVPYASLGANGEAQFLPPSTYRRWPGTEFSALLHLAQDATDRWLDRPLQAQGPELTIRTIQHWRQVATSQGTRFAVALLFAPTRGDFYRQRLRQEGIPLIDVAGTPYPGPGTAVPSDNHPNASIHKLWGEALASHLEKL
jgi:hypothetical protein